MSDDVSTPTSESGKSTPGEDWRRQLGALRSGVGQLLSDDTLTAEELRRALAELVGLR